MKVRILHALLTLLTAMTLQAETKPASKTQLATFGGGCFWCTEAVLERVPGVLTAVSGYAGGTVANPTYQDVCTFDPAVVGYEKILEVFFEAHDPTSLNRQGADEGTQYRSVILYHDEAQHAAAGRAKAAAQAHYADPIVTEIVPLTKFYPAEKYHQDYFKNNPGQGYCSFVIRPKVKKLQSKSVISKD
ncbi:MAG: peptide-methionine (S)-S-oxide reductase MsrA [Opitutae bacterium]|nr:peptide-methionine (S)-S-oxide reductase MsrA [Opitutae bacterium]